MSQPFAKAIDLLYLAKQNGVDIALNEDQLQLKLPRNKSIDKDLVEQLKNNKQLIIDFLKEHSATTNNTTAIKKVERDSLQHLPLSFSQERLWFIHQMEGSVQYHIPAVLRIQGVLNKSALAKSLQHIVRRHEVLRTIFVQEDGEPHQEIRNWEDWKLHINEGTDFVDHPEALHNYIQELINQPFDLSGDYMVRANLISLRENEYMLVVTMHHIASDGWSTSIIVREVAELYSAYSENREPHLQPLDIQYADYAVWQKDNLTGEVFQSKLEYWKNKLSGVSPFQLAGDKGRPTIRTTRGAVVHFEIEKSVSEQLQTISQEHDATLYMTLLAAFKVLLHTYSGQDDICVGSPIANRSRHEIEGLIGFFVNTLALRSEVDDDIPFSRFLRSVRETTMDAFERQDIPFEKVVEAVVRERDLSRNPLFQVMFVFQNTPEVDKLSLGKTILAREPLAQNTSKFDITLFVVETPRGLQCSFEYATDLFTKTMISKLSDHFRVLLESIVKTPDERVGSLRMITHAEEREVVSDFNQTPFEYPAEKSIVDLFITQAAKTPGAIALVIGNDQLTYRELDEKSNQLAAYLRSRGVRQETLVPLCIERGFLMIISVLGILKAGAAYVPIDPEYPQERVRLMLDDLKAHVLVVSEKTSSILQVSETVEVILLDKDLEILKSYPSENLRIDIRPEHLVYVLYTSGSTGRPKGVKMSGGGMVNMLSWQQKQLGNTHRNVLQFASLNFDVSFQEIFSTLCFGNTLILINSEARREMTEMVRVIENREITHLFIPFIVLKTLVEFSGSLTETAYRLQTIIVAGEQLKLTEDIWKFIITHRIQLINQYGPTEAHVVTSYTVDNNSELQPLPPIGKPIDNTQIYILNSHLAALPVNVPGEIFIGGVQVAQGYLNNEKLSAEKFLSDPFSKMRGAHMYKTGDLGRWLPDGNIEYLGRIDGQVKVRGYRIELGEIEAVLHQHEGVRQAVVLAREDHNGNNRLIAYITSEGRFDKESVVQYLKARLPEFMVPSLWVEMESLPVTQNGKVDRKRLPNPDVSHLLTNTYTAPRNETEAKLAAIWSDLLGVEIVGIHDNFFELGGHSLMAIRVISAIRKRMDVELTIKDVFTYTTIAELSEHTARRSKGSWVPLLEAATGLEQIPLSFSQERLWYIDQLEGSIQYHLSSVLRLKGDLNVVALNEAFKMVVDRHEVLRGVIYQLDGIPFIKIKDTNDFDIDIEDRFSGRPDKNQLRVYISGLIDQPFDLSRDTMIRISLIRLAKDEHILVTTMHHIASDGWSVAILVKEVVESYEAVIQNRKPKLVPLAIQYPDFAIWQRNLLQGEVLDKKLKYWREKLTGVSPLELPTDKSRPAVRSNRGAMAGFSIEKELTEQLQQLSQKNGATLFMTLLTTLNVLMSRYSNQEDICIGTPIAGRQDEQLENLIGFFINTLALRNSVNSNDSFQELLKEIRRTTLEAYEHQELPFEKIVDAVVTERDMSRTPVFQVMFVFQNAPAIPAFRLGEVQLTPEGHSYSTSQFDLSFIISETSNGLQAAINYSTDLFELGTVERMISNFRQLLSAIVSNPQHAVGLLPILSKEDQLQLHRFNNTKVEFPPNKNFITLFEEQVLHTPHSTAVIYGDDIINYVALNAKANQLAHYLRSKGADNTTRVAICMKRGLDMVVAILGVLKSGAAYVPIDPNYPDQRKTFMQQDSGAEIIICNHDQNLDPLPVNIQVIRLDSDSTVYSHPVDNVNIEIEKGQLAYVIYTSGSTGVPKGVMIEHQNVYSFIAWCRQEFAASNFEIVYASTSMCFDLSIFEIFYPLITGKKIRIIEDGAQIGKYLGKDKCVLINAVPSVIDNLIKEQTDFSNVTVINMAGEPVPVNVLQNLATDRMEVRNLYGPTEDTTYSTVFRLNRNEPVLIGKPISNSSIYIVDKGGQLVPIGVPGEILIGGAGVTRGYLNRPDLTQEKFIPDPFDHFSSYRVYKTGDVGRWLPNGNIEYLGRLDQQVKIRGFRIEPEEIEVILHQSGLFTQTMVLPKVDRDGNKQLVAYVVPRQPFNKDQAINYLRAKVPQYMVPTAWITLNSFPLTPNGKIDKKALPNPEVIEVSRERVAPRNRVERTLAHIWERVLGPIEIDIHDNFFTLGGHSLMAIRVISTIRKELGVDLPLIDMYESSLKSIAEKIIAKQAGIIIKYPSSAKPDSGDVNNIMEIARRLEVGIVEWGANGNEQYMMPIKDQGTKNPFFGLISFKQYSLLGKYMPNDHPLYYLPPTRSASVEEIASHYVKEIKLAYPSGPYTIGGFCGAGMVALEIAQQLKAAGEHVSALILFEYYSPDSTLSKKSLKYHTRLLSHYKKRIISHKKSTVKGIDLVKFILKKSYKKVKNYLKPPPPKFFTSPEFRKYRHKPYSGKVVLFQASIAPLEATDSRLMGWGNYFKGEVEVITIKGGHLGIFREPEIRKLAQELSVVLDEVNSNQENIQKSTS